MDSNAGETTGDPTTEKPTSDKLVDKPEAAENDKALAAPASEPKAEYETVKEELYASAPTAEETVKLTPKIELKAEAISPVQLTTPSPRLKGSLTARSSIESVNDKIS